MNNVMKYLLLTLMAMAPWAWAADDEFVIQDIQVEGLQRISAGTVFNYLPVSVGSTITPADYPSVIRTLFQTGFFADVSLARGSGDVLVITVTERPAIAEINISGNRDITTDNLKKALEGIGLAEGRVFDRSLLDQLEQELLRQYFSRGKYAVRVNTQVKPLPRNRVGISLDISEGVSARIRQINIVGNRVFDDDDLLDEFQLSTTGWLSFYTKDDQYSKQKLSADIEALRSFYLDQGYLKFTVDSTQVSITPDKKDIYVTINITEGERYAIRDVRLAGNLIVPEEELLELITVEPGETFSRSVITEITEKIINRLGDEGYAFANVNTVPELIEPTQEVMLTFVVDPGNRVYVRRINFIGNVKTQDEVMRREMRQIEGAWFSTKDVERSKERLERLTYLGEVNVETPAVPGTTDQVDVNFSVNERASGNLILGVGFGQEAGLLFNAQVTQNNFLGTGNRVNAAVNTGKVETELSLSYTNPYWTDDGISLGFDAFFREQEAKEANLADFTTDAIGAGIDLGVPISEFDTVFGGLGYERQKIGTRSDTPLEILEFVEVNGDQYDNYRFDASFARDSRNRVLFADGGSLNRISADIVVPGSDLKYYKLRYRHQSFYPLFKPFVGSLRADLGYGNGYSGTDELPFFENFFAGGLRTVRGYKSNTLGPRFSNGDPSGGSVLLVGGAELVFPVPFFADSENIRLSTFVDGGNVFSSGRDVEFNELRYSVGASVMWLSPFGPLVLSLAAPLNKKAEDETEAFQFSFGVPF